MQYHVDIIKAMKKNGHGVYTEQVAEGLFKMIIDLRNKENNELIEGLTDIFGSHGNTVAVANGSIYFIVTSPDVDSMDSVMRSCIVGALRVHLQRLLITKDFKEKYGLCDVTLAVYPVDSWKTYLWKRASVGNQSQGSI